MFMGMNSMKSSYRLSFNRTIGFDSSVGVVLFDTANVCGDSSGSYKVMPFVDEPFQFLFGQIDCDANKKFVVSCMMKKTSVDKISAHLIVSSGEVAGIDESVSAVLISEADEWVKVTLPLMMSTENGLLSIRVKVFGSSVHSVFIDEKCVVENG